MYQTQQLSYSDAQKILNVALEDALAAVERVGKGAAIAIVDDHGELIAFLRTDGCPLSSINIAINKAFTAARQHQESRELGDDSRRDNFPLTNFGELRYVGWGGGVPIEVDGKVVGGLGVSGLPEEVDMEIARKAAGSL
jgi:glc operon protein GlcG